MIISIRHNNQDWKVRKGTGAQFNNIPLNVEGITCTFTFVVIFYPIFFSFPAVVLLIEYLYFCFYCVLTLPVCCILTYIILFFCIVSANPVTAIDLTPTLSMLQHVEQEQETQGEMEAATMLSVSSKLSIFSSVGSVQEPLPLVVVDDIESFDDSDHEGVLTFSSPPCHAPPTHPELLDSCSEAEMNNHYRTKCARSTNSTTSLPSFPSSSRHGKPPAMSKPIRRVSFQSNIVTSEDLSSGPRPPIMSKPSKIPYQRDRDVASGDGDWVGDEAGKRVGASTYMEGIHDDQAGNQESVTEDTAVVASRRIRRTIPKDGISGRDTSKQWKDSVMKSGEEVRVGVTFQKPDKAPKGLYLIPLSTAAPPGNFPASFPSPPSSSIFLIVALL